MLARRPAPVAVMSGTTPRMKAIEVIRMGRKRRRVASTAASTVDIPSALSPQHLFSPSCSDFFVHAFFQLVSSFWISPLWSQGRFAPSSTAAHCRKIPLNPPASHSGVLCVPTTLSRITFSGQGAARDMAVSTSIASRMMTSPGKVREAHGLVASCRLAEHQPFEQDSAM